MAHNIYTRHTVSGSTTYSRKGTQGRKPIGLGYPKLYRLYDETNVKLATIKEVLGTYYNENDLIREAAKKHVDFIYTELVKQ